MKAKLTGRTALLLSFLPLSSLLLPSCAWSTEVYRIITCPLTQGNLVFEGEASLYPLEDGEVWGLKLSPRKYYGLKVESRLRGDKDPQGVLDRSFALDKVVRVHPGNVFEVEWDAPGDRPGGPRLRRIRGEGDLRDRGLGRDGRLAWRSELPLRGDLRPGPRRGGLQEQGPRAGPVDGLGRGARPLRAFFPKEALSGGGWPPFVLKSPRWTRFS